MDARERGLAWHEAVLAVRENNIAQREAAVPVREEHANSANIDTVCAAHVKEVEALKRQTHSLITDLVRVNGWCKSYSPPSTVNNIAVGPVTKPSLLTLPGELRNRIFCYVVVPDDEVEVKIVCLRKVEGRFIWRVEPSRPKLAFTCKALVHEVCSLYFGETTFRFCRRSFEPKFEVQRMQAWAGYLGEDASYLHELLWDVSVKVNQSFKGQAIPLHVRLSCVALRTSENGPGFSMMANVKECDKALMDVLRQASHHSRPLESSFQDGEAICLCELTAPPRGHAEEHQNGKTLLAVLIRSLRWTDVRFTAADCAVCNMRRLHRTSVRSNIST